MSPVISAARERNQLLRKGIPTAADIQNRAEALAIVREIMILTEYFDRMLLSMDYGSYAQLRIYGCSVTLARYEGINYGLWTKVRGRSKAWTITSFVNEVAEWALANGKIAPLYQ